MTIIPEDFQIHKPDKKLLKKMDSIEIDEKILLKIESDFHNITVVESKIGRFLKYLEDLKFEYFNNKDHYP